MTGETNKFIFKIISPDTLEAKNIEMEVPDLSFLNEQIGPSEPENAVGTKTQDTLSIECQILLAEAECQKAVDKYNEWLNWWDLNQVNLYGEDRDAKWQSVIQAYESSVYWLRHLASVKGVDSIYDPNLPRILLPIQDRIQRIRQGWAEPIPPKKLVTMASASKVDALRQFIEVTIFTAPLFIGTVLYMISSSTRFGIVSGLILYIILFFWFKSHREALAIRRGEVDSARKFYLLCRNINPTAKETMDAMRRWYQVKAELQALEWYKQPLQDDVD